MTLRSMSIHLPNNPNQVPEVDMFVDKAAVVVAFKASKLGVLVGVTKVVVDSNEDMTSETELSDCSKLLRRLTAIFAYQSGK